MTGRAGALASLMLLGTIVGMVLVERTQTARPITATQKPIARLRPTPTARPLPLAPPRGIIPGWLHTDGTRIVDATNHPIRLASINWYGAEGAPSFPAGIGRATRRTPIPCQT